MYFCLVSKLDLLLFFIPFITIAVLKVTSSLSTSITVWLFNSKTLEPFCHKARSTKTFFYCENINFFLFDLELSNSLGAAYVMYATQMDPDNTQKTCHTISATSRRLCYTHPLIPELDCLLGVVQHTTSKLKPHVVVSWEKQAFPATVGCTEKIIVLFNPKLIIFYSIFPCIWAINECWPRYICITLSGQVVFFLVKAKCNLHIIYSKVLKSNLQ